MSLAFAAAVFAGFARTYFLRSYFQSQPLTLLLQVHGFLFTAWIALFSVQTALVAARRTDVHRRLGWVGAALAVLMVAAASTAAIASVRQRILAGSPEAARAFLAIPAGSIVAFVTLVAAAIFYRRWPDTHKRLMLLGSVAILDAAIARWPIQFVQTTQYGYYVLTDLFIAAAIAYDVLSRGRIGRTYLWGGALIVAQQPLRELVGHTAAWQTFARMIAG
jgi:hypothetical protein